MLSSSRIASLLMISDRALWVTATSYVLWPHWLSTRTLLRGYLSTMIRTMGISLYGSVLTAFGSWSNSMGTSLVSLLATGLPSATATSRNYGSFSWKKHMRRLTEITRRSMEDSPMRQLRISLAHQGNPSVIGRKRWRQMICGEGWMQPIRSSSLWLAGRMWTQQELSRWRATPNR